MLKSKFPVILVILIFRRGLCAFPPSLRYILPVLQNKVLNVNTTCDGNSLNVSVIFEQPFKGLLFAKDFSQECGSIGKVIPILTKNLLLVIIFLGTLSNIGTIYFPTSGCGIKLSSTDNEEDNMYFSVMLVIQQDRHLKQITDQEKLIKCNVKGNTFSLKSKPMIEEFKNELITMKKEVSFR